MAVINNGKPVFYTRGFANPDTKLSFDSATLFEIGSITKTFTAYLLQKILFENNIADTSSIIRYLPDSVQQNKALQKITFLSLMNHTSGLPRLPETMEVEEGNKNPYDYYGAGKLFTYLKTCTPAPDGKSNYSNLGMGLAGVLAEMITKKKYAILLEENIFRPFKMIASTDDFSADGNKSQGFFDDEKTGYWEYGCAGTGRWPQVYREGDADLFAVHGTAARSTGSQSDFRIIKTYCSSKSQDKRVQSMAQL